MDIIYAGADGWLGVVSSLALILASHLGNKYIIPFLKVGKRQKYAQYIAQIADELTDDLRQQYQDKKWLEHLDEAVDRLIEICGIDQAVARRAINAALNRKQV